jgi:hypothetical protein
MRIRTTTIPGASPLPDHRDNSNKQTCPHRRGIGTVAPRQSVGECYTGASVVSVVVSIAVAMVGGDR